MESQQRKFCANGLHETSSPDSRKRLMPMNDDEETHKYKRIETKTYKATLFRPERMKIVLLCSDCGKIKVVDL
jgi:hypothetical protein